MASFNWLLQNVSRGEELNAGAPRGPSFFVLLLIFFLLKNIIYINFLKELYVMWWVHDKYLI